MLNILSVHFSPSHHIEIIIKTSGRLKAETMKLNCENESQNIIYHCKLFLMFQLKFHSSVSISTQF